MIWLLPHPVPSPTISKLDRRIPGRLRKIEKLGDVGGGGAKSFDGEKNRFSINHSILSGIICSTCQLVPHHSLKSLSYWF
jgi:hypothetical protein